MSDRQETLSGRTAGLSANLVPAAVYLSLALFPGWWGDDGRARLFFQFYIVEFCGGLMVGAVGRLVLERSVAMATFGAGLILVACLSGIVVVGWTTRSVALMALIAVPLLPRVVDAVRLARSGRWMGAMMLREGVISTAGCMLIGLSYLLLMSAGPNDPPATRSVPPPIWYTASAMALYYVVLGYYAGNPRGLDHWAKPMGRY